MAACASRQLPASTSGRVVDAVLLAFRQQRQSFAPTNLAGPQLKAFRRQAAARWQALEDRIALASNSLWTTGAGQVGIPETMMGLLGIHICYICRLHCIHTETDGSGDTHACCRATDNQSHQ